jgi:hypothetical protein
MRPALARALTRLYPRPWRERYGAEFEALLEDGGGGPVAWANVVRSAMRERVFPTQGRDAEGGTMNESAQSFGAVARRPSAFLPVAMSLTALAIVLGHVVFYGAAREADEGAAAHLWQLLMAGQAPVLAFFAIKWLPRAPRQTLAVLGVQAGAVLASLAPVYFLNL